MFDIKISNRKKDNVIFAKNCFDEENINNKEIVIDIVSGALTALHRDFTFTSSNSDDLPNYINVIVAYDSFKINLKFTTDTIYDLDRGDFLAFPSDLEFNCNQKEKVFKIYKIYYYPKINNTAGKNKYTIRATIEDNYNIEIYADTEKEALQKAYNTPLPEWNHEEIKNRPEKIKLIRWASWGNFKIVDKK